MINLVDFSEYDSKKEELKTLPRLEEKRTDDPVTIDQITQDHR